MEISDEVKHKFRKVLKKHKDNIEHVKNSLGNIDETKEARKQLRDAEISILTAMHEISWIGLKREKEIQKEVLQYTNEDNPSAYMG